jgi:hypothetical protein
MSWCRWGSLCTNSIPGYAVDELCEDCPGSSLYVYESSNGFLVCCSCPFDRSEEPADYEAETEEQMLRHLIEHHKNGQHVRRSLLWRAVFGTEPDLTSEWKEIRARISSLRP